MKYFILIIIVFAIACNEPGTGTSTKDSMPVMNPGPVDTTSVVTPPSTGDTSHVVRPDSAVLPK